MILQARGLTKYFPLRRGIFLQTSGYVRALEKVDLSIGQGEILGLVGESGCGKTTLGRVLVQIYGMTAGSIEYREPSGRIHRFNRRLPRRVRRSFQRDVQMIFQDPFGSLDPRMTIGDILREPLEVHQVYPAKREMDRYIEQLLLRVGLSAEYASRYPHEFSGGQRQRISIARALALKPRLVICDEPTSALDVSVQSQVINLLMELKRQADMTYLFISHNLDLVYHVSDRIMVMYLGGIVEEGRAEAVFEEPRHPYTRVLMASVPTGDPQQRRLDRISLEGEPPSPIDPPPGCPFHTRCAQVMEVCKSEKPLLQDLGGGHRAACHLYGQGDDGSGGP